MASNASGENIKVVVRCRPLTKKEIASGFHEVVKMNPETKRVMLVKDPKDDNPKTFVFNSVFPNDTTQMFIYDDCGRPVVDAVLEGYNGTVFAYGQTGTGKTYTMEGDIASEEDKGIILHAFDHIFAHISKEKNKTFLVRASFLQIYMEDVCDLLGDPLKKLHVRQIESQVSVLGLSSHIVKSPEEIMELLKQGKGNRTTGATAMNAQSSRSHSVFTIVIEQQEPDGRTKMGKLNLVDLAGSERLGKTEATGMRQKEAAKINRSLLSLGNVISALVTGSKHVAYRDSKLTQLLQDSLGGNAKTVMVATLGPAVYNYDETLSTLIYANRARDIKNIPKINEDPKDALLGQLKAQIESLRAQLDMQNSQTAGGGVIVGDTDFLRQIKEKHEGEVKKLMREKNMNEGQRQQMRDQLDEEYEKQKTTKEETERLRAKIDQMQKSVLVGGVNLVDKAKQQKEDMRAELARMKQQEQERKRLTTKSEREKDEMLLAKKQYSSRREEVKGKFEEIKKMRKRIKKMKVDLNDKQRQFEREKEEQVEQIGGLERELELLKMITAGFIPDSDLEVISRHCKYSEDDRKYIIDHVDMAGCHRKIDEDVQEEAVFIQGIDGAIFAAETKPSGVDNEKKAEAMRKKRRARGRALNEFALGEIA